MSLLNVYNYLINDTMGLQASSVQASNPILFPTVASVPPYAYQPLSQIWVGSSAGSSQMSSRVVYQLGMGLEEALGEITLMGLEIQSNEYPGHGFDSNAPGAETMELVVVLRQPDSIKNWNRIVQAELRIRYLLDENWRKTRKRTSPFIPNTDPSVDGDVRCTRMRQLEAPNAKELHSRYVICYTRAVPS